MCGKNTLNACCRGLTDAALLHFEISATARVPREAVYSAYTDFASMPKWSKNSSGARISRQQGDIVYVHFESARKGAVSGERRLRLLPPGRVESETETRFTRTRMIVEFKEVPEGTQVTATLDVRVKGTWGRLFTTRGKDEIEPPAREELAAFVKYVEGLNMGEESHGDRQERDV
jgi:hypothetical protein